MLRYLEGSLLLPVRFHVARCWSLQYSFWNAPFWHLSVPSFQHFSVHAPFPAPADIFTTNKFPLCSTPGRAPTRSP